MPGQEAYRKRSRMSGERTAGAKKIVRSMSIDVHVWGRSVTKRHPSNSLIRKDDRRSFSMYPVKRQKGGDDGEDSIQDIARGVRVAINGNKDLYTEGRGEHERHPSRDGAWVIRPTLGSNPDN